MSDVRMGSYLWQSESRARTTPRWICWVVVGETPTQWKVKRFSQDISANARKSDLLLLGADTNLRVETDELRSQVRRDRMKDKVGRWGSLVEEQLRRRPPGRSYEAAVVGLPYDVQCRLDSMHKEFLGALEAALDEALREGD